MKIPNYEWTIFAFAAVPLLFAWYKRRNSADVFFFRWYGCIATLIAISRAVGIWWWPLIPITGQTLALSVMVLNVTAYGCYVFIYYERYARQIDERRFAPAVGGA